MKYYSTNKNAPMATLNEAVVKGLAGDRGLYMPERINKLPQSFFDNIENLSFQEIAYEVAKAFFGEDVEAEALKNIVYDTLQFECPLTPALTPALTPSELPRLAGESNLKGEGDLNNSLADGKPLLGRDFFALELFHGPTLAFKDVGARFMARLLQYFINKTNIQSPSPFRERVGVRVLVATSGDTGSAVANGFLGVDGIHVYVLYPKNKVSKIQECQFTTLGKNITAIEVDGAFDDCQALVKSAFMDEELTSCLRLTSANSINVARFLPQAFYYFNAYAQLKRMGKADQMVVCVPSGNFGNICAALFGAEMGLPIKRFIAANNANDIFYNYLQTGKYEPKASIQTIANAMDVGDPSNFARIYDLYDGDHAKIVSRISGTTYNDEQIRETMNNCYAETGYILDPHGACGYRALQEGLQEGETGVFCETAHPAKFKDTVEAAIGAEVAIPERLAAFMKGTKQSVPMTKDFSEFKKFLLSDK